MINFDPAIPIYQQLMKILSGKMIRGELPPGAKVPSVRELAKALQVNPNTVARAYQELEREGIVFTKRGMGTFVAEEETVLADLREEWIGELVAGFFEEMAKIGIEPQNALQKAEKYVRGEREDARSKS